MTLSAPIYILKQQARSLAREEGIALQRALDRIARREGFRSWSLLAARAAAPIAVLERRVRPGTLALLGSRRGQGKTLLSLELVLNTLRRGDRAAFFTLDFTRADVARCFQTLGGQSDAFSERFLIDDSDDICADYIVGRLAGAPAGTLVVVDYLQLLDQKRENPDLAQQVQRLRNAVRERGWAALCLSQLHRRYDPAVRPCPGIDDVRLPNPLDLRLFDTACFLEESVLQSVSIA
jgi:replicative DNA helicase